MNSIAPNTTELSELQLCLRSDLEFAMQEYGGEKYFIIEDRANARFYQIGVSEYTFISLLDGCTTLSEALRLTAVRLGQDAFTEQNAISIVKWLVDSQLVTTADSTDTQRLVEAAAKVEARSRVSRLNPLMVKIPLFNPERVLDSLTPWFGWMTSKAAVVGWIVVCVLALQQLLTKSESLSLSANSVFDRSNWIWLSVTWLTMKFFHELGHALTCRRFGGQVRDCGIMLILFAPIPYVDVTSSWRFPSKWQRIATSAAGMFVEVGMAAAAVIVWSLSDDPVVQHHAYNVIVLGSITTIAFNANFLMRFDGYYMLADWLEIPNLYSLGQQYLSYFGRRYALGVELSAPRWKQAFAIKTYGVASLVWRVFVCLCLAIAAQALFFGFGLILSAAAAVLWLGLPLWRFAVYLFKGKDTERPSLVRFGVLCGLVAAFCVASFTIIPWPARVSAPAIVQYAGHAVLHVEAAGIVQSVHVKAGQTVTEGDLLLTLANPELDSQLREIELTLEQSRIRSRLFHLRHQLGAYQAEVSAMEALEMKATELRSQVAALQVFASHSGEVVARDLHTLADRYLPIGAKLLTIADESKKEIVLSIHQDKVAQFRAQVGQAVTVCTTPFVPLSCEINRVQPQGSTEVTNAGANRPSIGSDSRSISGGQRNGRLVLSVFASAIRRHCRAIEKRFRSLASWPTRACENTSSRRHFRRTFV